MNARLDFTWMVTCVVLARPILTKTAQAIKLVLTARIIPVARQVLTPLKIARAIPPFSEPSQILALRALQIFTQTPTASRFARRVPSTANPTSRPRTRTAADASLATCPCSLRSSTPGTRFPTKLRGMHMWRRSPSWTRSSCGCTRAGGWRRLRAWSTKRVILISIPTIR